MVHSIPGMENAAIVRPGYGIEYDYFPPEQLRATLESKMVGGLFFAGQINGTSGYEEAACQGLIAGINAAEYVFRGEELILSREEAYIGVLIDDLVTKGTEEPYRMFTSRAEYRLLLRQDNADERLMTIAAQRKLIQPEVYNRRRKVWERKKSLKNEISNLQIESAEWNTRYPEKKIKGKTNAAILLKRPRVSIDEIALFGLPSENRDCLLGVEADIKYEGFVQKQKTGIERTKAMDGFCIPSTLHFDDVQGLLLESRKKLQKIRPETLGQASRIPGVTPADVTALMKYCIQKKRKGNHNKNSHSHVSRETVTL